MSYIIKYNQLLLLRIKKINLLCLKKKLIFTCFSLVNYCCKVICFFIEGGLADRNAQPLEVARSDTEFLRFIKWLSAG